MKNHLKKYSEFLNEAAGDNLSASAVYNMKIDSLKDKIKANFEKANQSQAKAQEFTEKGDADKAALETLKYRKALAATTVAQIDYKIFLKTEAIKKEKEKQAKK